jgi:hypothetical protein
MEHSKSHHEDVSTGILQVSCNPPVIFYPVHDYFLTSRLARQSYLFVFERYETETIIDFFIDKRI